MHRHSYIAAMMLTALLCLGSCLGESNQTKVSDVCTVSTLTFGKNDSIPNLQKASFKIDSDSDPGLIINPDSLPYGTRIDSVFPKFTFGATIAAAILYVDNQEGLTDTIVITGTDTVDFSQQPVRLRVISSDLEHSKDYEIYVLVHQVEGGLYVWDQLTEQAHSQEGSMQRAVWHNDQLMWYVNTGVSNHLYTSATGTVWQQATDQLTGLPNYCDLTDLTAYRENLYFTAPQQLYSSPNGLNWEAHEAAGLIGGYSFNRLLFGFADSLRAIVSNGDRYCFASSADAATWKVGQDIPEGFPIEGFATTVYPSPTGRMQAIVLGGNDASGKQVNARWLTTDFLNWINLSVEQPSFGSLSGASVIYYDKRLFLFGGTNSNNELRSYPMLSSGDDGLHWIVPDTTSNRLPDGYEARTGQSVVLTPDGYSFYIIGGRTRTDVLRDVWHCRKNSIDW